MKGLKPIRGVLSLKQIGTICFVFLFSVFSTNLFATDPNIPANATSASCTNSTLNTYSGTSNLQANWEANQIGLYWYSDGNQITDIQSVATTCDYDGGLTVPSNPPTKTGYTFNGWKVRGVPEGYTRLQYIQGACSAAYINTNIPVNTLVSPRIVARFQMVSSGDYDWFGTSSNASGTIIWDVKNNSSPVLYIRWGTTSSRSASFSASKLVFNDAFHTLDIGGVDVKSQIPVKVDGVSIGYLSANSSAAMTSTQELQIFRSRSNCGTSKYASFTVYSNGVPVFNGIPARRDSDSVLGMWDTVSGTFKISAGSGTFTAGPVVQ